VQFQVIFSFILVIFGLTTADASHSPLPLQSEIERRAVAYFVENSHPLTGLTLDKANNLAGPPQVDHVASIAATGFSLAVQANAAARGLLDWESTYRYVEKTLLFASTKLLRRNGWFYHFVDWKTGQREFTSEISTIDTSLFIAGALYAGKVFKNTKASHLANELYANLDFYDFLTDGGQEPNKLTLSMGYLPECGYITTQWDMYAEQMILLILGLGHPQNPLPPEAWLAFSRTTKNELMGLDQALFVHQYSQLFLDLRDFKDAYGENYFDNSRSLSLLQRNIARHDETFKTYKAGYWGFSAGLAPLGYEVAHAKHYRSTACVSCVLASVMFAPREVFGDLRLWLKNGASAPGASPLWSSPLSAFPLWASRVSSSLWGRYGLTDSVDIDNQWISDLVLGITVGPSYLSFANLKAETSIWKHFMEIPPVKEGLVKAAKASLEDLPKLKPRRQSTRSQCYVQHSNSAK